VGNTKSLWGELAQEVVLFSGLAVAIVLLQGSSAVALIVLLSLALVTLALWHDRYDRWSFLVVAVFGTCLRCSSCTMVFGAKQIRTFSGSPCGSL
jgi:hypothetical protein